MVSEISINDISDLRLVVRHYRRSEGRSYDFSIVEAAFVQRSPYAPDVPVETRVIASATLEHGERIERAVAAFNAVLAEPGVAPAAIAAE